MSKKGNSKGKSKMSITRLTNLLYETASSLVPGTGELYNTEYANEDEYAQKEEEKQK